MRRIAITGHRGLPGDTETEVDREIRRFLTQHSRNAIIGVSLLADGPDQLFARAVLDIGGELVAIVPAHKYRDALPPRHWPAYDQLLSQASEVVRLDYEESTEQAHMAASDQMLSRADLLLAVWDGKPARGYGGTADVVAHARTAGLPVTVIWPPGSTRE